jgi:ribosomal protein L16 Arg81 hydroxylase
MHRRIEQILQDTAGDDVEFVFPSFVVGAIASTGGGPTHFDQYDSVVLLLAGEKTFYIAPPNAFERSHASEGARDPPEHRCLPPVTNSISTCFLSAGAGAWNERLDLSPFDEDGEHLWRRVDMRAGDVMFLPSGWWHFVTSSRRCLMTNIWEPTPP